MRTAGLLDRYLPPWTDRLFQWWRVTVGAAVHGPCGRTLQTLACFADAATNAMCRSGELGLASPRTNQSAPSLTLDCRFPRDGNEGKHYVDQTHDKNSVLRLRG